MPDNPEVSEDSPESRRLQTKTPFAPSRASPEIPAAKRGEPINTERAAGSAREESIMRPTERCALHRIAGTGLLLATLAVWTATRPAMAAESATEHPTATVSVTPWFLPCQCELEPLGEPTVDPEAGIDWPTGFAPPAEGKPRKLKVGDVIEFRASGSFDAGITTPDDWTFSETLSDVEDYIWQPGRGAVDVTSDYLEAPLPKNRRYYRFTESGNPSLTVRYKRTIRNEYNCPLRKRTTPLDTCGEPAGPCPLSGAVKDEPRTVDAEDESSTISYPLRVYDLELKVRRKGGSGGFGSNAKTAAGGLGSDVHIAEVEAKLKPPADDGDSYSFAVKLTAPHPDYKPGPVRPHTPSWLTWDQEKGYFTGTITANKDGWSCAHDSVDENENAITTTHYHEIISSRKLGSSTLAGDEPYVTAIATMNFEWGDGDSGVDADEEFEPCEWEPVPTYLELEADPIDGHGIAYHPTEGNAWFWVTESIDEGTGFEEGYWDLFDVLTEIEYPGDNGTMEDWEKLMWYTNFDVAVGYSDVFDENDNVIGTTPILSGNRIWTATTDAEEGKADMWQIHYANDWYVTDSITFEAEDTQVVE